MTEQEWLNSTDPAALRSFLGERFSKRKQRLFACALCRNHRDPWVLATVASAEKDADAEERGVTMGRFGPDMLSVHDLVDSFVGRLDSHEQTHLLRHLVGNPFRLVLVPVCWPMNVVALAQALYDGELCSFALHDALLEAGHTNLAEHFKDEFHPKGCWGLDLILNKDRSEGERGSR